MFYALARPLLFALDPETAHNLALRFSGAAALCAARPPACPVRVMGLDFANAVGLAAGLDKHAEHVDALAALGFGFLELGGGTPPAQPRHPRPPLFPPRPPPGPTPAPRAPGSPASPKRAPSSTATA